MNGFSLGPKAEVYDAEVLGLCGGLEAALSRPMVGLISGIHVCTDNLSIAQKAGSIPNGSSQAGFARFKEAAQSWIQHGKRITVQWVPSHMGIQGNEKADIEAKKHVDGCNRGDTNFSSCPKYKHEVGTGTGEKIAAHGYGNVDLRMSDLKGNTNTVTVTNVSWAPKLGHNLLSTIPFAKKGVEVFLRKAGQPSEIIKPATVNRATAPTMETWHARMGHLGYRSLLELPKLASGIEVKGPAPTEICGGCMKGRSQRKPSRTPMTRATEFLEEIHSDLGGPLPPTRWGEQYYISFYDDATGAYYVKTMRHKSQAFEKFLEKSS